MNVFLGLKIQANSNVIKLLATRKKEGVSYTKDELNMIKACKKIFYNSSLVKMYRTFLTG